MKTLARERDRAELLRRLRALTPDRPARWGSMSAHQMVCHLADAFRMSTGEIPVRARTGPFQRTVLKWVALYVPLPWPAGIATSPEIDQRSGGTPPTEFGADVRCVATLVAGIASGAAPADRPPHPIFGVLSESQWLRWAWLHTDHHLRQFGG